MAEAHKVIVMPQRSQTGGTNGLASSPTTWPGPPNSADITELVRKEVRGELQKIHSWRAGSEIATVDEVFADLESSHYLTTALRLLEIASQHLQSAIETSEGDPMFSDDEMQQLQALLPELFCCRMLGDGFGALITAMQYSFVNREGMPFEPAQMQAISRVLTRLRYEPYLSHDSAVELAMELEDAGLNVDPPALTHLLGEPGEPSAD